MDKRTTVKGKKKLILSAKRKKRRLPPEAYANRRRRIEEQTLPPEVPSSSQSDIVSSDTTDSTLNFQPSVTSTPYTKGNKKKPHKRSVPAHLMKWRLQQKQKYKEKDESGPSTSSTSLESNLQNSVLDSANFDVSTIAPPINSSVEPAALNNAIDTIPMRSSEGSLDVEYNVWNNIPTRKYKETDESGPSTSFASLESNLQNSVLDSANFDISTIAPPINSSVEPAALNNAIDNTPMRSSEGSLDVENNVWNNIPTRYEYPELTVEPDGRPPKDNFNIISGRFIVDGKHIVQELRSLDYHRYECEKSSNGYMTLVSSHSKSLEWTLKFKCPFCQKCKIITSDPKPEVSPQNVPETTAPILHMTLVDQAVWGFASIGSGHRNMEEVLTTMNILPPNEKTFKKTEERLGKVWQDVLFDSMKQAGMEEKRLAIENGDVTTNNIPYITVVVDGGWSHRSHGHRYSANSGVVCVIGLRTKKLLNIDVRNKYCSMCTYLEKKGVSTVHDNCYKNWDGASASMESDMIVSAFNSSEEIHGLQYRKIIGDGDSSVHKKIIEMVPYGRYVEKIECSNHMIKNYTKRLYKIREEGNAEKRVLNQTNIKRLKAAVRGTITHYASEKNIDNLKADMRNGPFHVLGYHKNCKAYFCKEIGTGNVIEGPTLNVLKKIEIALKPLLLKASTLWHNQTSNLAENYMSLVAKFCGGKQVNRGKRGSFNYRTNAAALDFQFGPMWHYQTMKSAMKKSPALLVKRTCLSRVKRNLSCRNSLLKRFRNNKTFKKMGNQITKGMKDYGPLCQKIDIDDAEMEEEKANLLSSLALSQEEKNNLEKETRGQSENSRWLEERKLRVTASNFGLICKRLPKSKWAPVVKQLLYSKVSTNAMLYGQLHESSAINAFEQMYNIQVQPCGLFVDKQHDFLAASPDGLVGSDYLIEVKCPKTAENLTISEALKEVKSFCLEKQHCGNVRLKRNHNYYYQIQGQLHVADKKSCYFVVWTKKDVHVEQIERDQRFWVEKMEKKLHYFYHYALLPEIIDPRTCRSMAIREPSIPFLDFICK